MNYEQALKSIRTRLLQNQGSGVVGVFDSGVGGLTALPGLMNNGYKEIVYLGDTANFPYGEKDEPTLSIIVLSRINDLINQGAERICIACNTASINFSRMDKTRILSDLITCTVSCTASAVYSMDSVRRIGLIGTKYTVLTNAYYDAINTLSVDKNKVLIQSAEQELVKYIEEGSIDKQREEVQRISRYFNSLKVDALVLGCTHYSHVKESFRDQLRSNIKIIDPSELLGKSITLDAYTNKKSNLNISFTDKVPPFAENYFSL